MSTIKNKSDLTKETNAYYGYLQHLQVISSISAYQSETRGKHFEGYSIIDFTLRLGSGFVDFDYVIALQSENSRRTSLVDRNL